MSSLSRKRLLERHDALLTQVEELVITLRELRPAVESLVDDADDRDGEADGDDSPSDHDSEQPLVKQLETLLLKHGPLTRRALSQLTRADPQAVRDALGTAKAILNEVDMTWRYTGKDA